MNDQMRNLSRELKLKKKKTAEILEHGSKYPRKLLNYLVNI